MYAKLVFPAETENTQVARDITRAIVNSTGAGGSTVGALEFVDAGKSTIDDTVAANWTLAAGDSIPTGATVEQDKRFHLQQAHANGETKTVAIGMHIFNPAVGFTVANDTTGYNSVRLSPVMDFGQSYVAYACHPATTATANTTLSPWVGVSAKRGECTVHIIARDKVIAIAGDKNGYFPSANWTLIQEPPETYEQREGRNRPGQITMMGARAYNTGFSHANVSSKLSVTNYTSTNIMNSSYPNGLMMFFTDYLYEYSTSQEIRLAGIAKDNWFPSSAIPSNSDPSSQVNCWYLKRDVAQADGYNTDFAYDTIGTPGAEEYFFPRQSSNWAYSQHPMSIDPTSHYFNEEFNGRAVKDIAGAAAINLTPLMTYAGNSGQLIDYTTSSGLYTAGQQAPRTQKIINDGTNDYLVLPVGDTSGNKGSFAIRTI